MWLTNLRVVLPDRTLERGSIRIDGGLIAEVCADDVTTADDTLQRVDGHGLTAIPGLIDMHGDMIEQEAEPRNGAHLPLDLAIHELDRRLAAAGITTAYASISFWEPESEERKVHRSGDRAAQLVGAVAHLRDELLIDLRVHARYELTTPSVAEPLRTALLAGHVQLLSLMDHTPGQGQYRDVDRYVSYLAAYRNTSTDQLAAEAHARIRRAQEDDSYWRVARELVTIAKSQGLPLASHDDDTPEKVDLMLRLGVTISEFPVAMAAAHAARAQGMHVAMGAPNALRGTSHSGNLSARAAIKAGVVDLLAADYSPSAMLHAAWVLAAAGTPLHEAIALVSRNPADALGLTDLGQIVAGYAADLVLVEDGSPPRVRATIRRGRLIYWDGSMHQRTPWMR